MDLANGLETCPSTEGEEPSRGATTGGKPTARRVLRGIGIFLAVGIVAVPVLGFLVGGITGWIACRGESYPSLCGWAAIPGAIGGAAVGLVVALVAALVWREGGISRNAVVGGSTILACPSCGQRTALGAECQWCDRPLDGEGHG